MVEIREHLIIREETMWRLSSTSIAQCVGGNKSSLYFSQVVDALTRVSLRESMVCKARNNGIPLVRSRCGRNLASFLCHVTRTVKLVNRTLKGRERSRKGIVCAEYDTGSLSEDVSRKERLEFVPFSSRRASFLRLRYYHAHVVVHLSRT